MKTRRLTSPWPFLYSLVNGRWVQNLPPKPVKPKRLRKVAPNSKWTQETLL